MLTRPIRRLAALVVPLGLLATPLGGCGEPEGGAEVDAAVPAAERTGVRADPALARTLERATALADSIEDLLRPVPLMRTAQVDGLRRYPNAEHVARARRLGVPPGDSAALAGHIDEGRLVRLEDSADHWVVRELGASIPYVTPDARALLVRLGEAFHQKLEGMGLPPYRFEISSALRTAESQAALRRRNENAAAGVSSHEFGTTVDIAYSGYAAPATLPAGLVPEDAADGRALQAVARAVLERMAARKSRELQALLGQVMAEAQSRGDVLVTLEQLQPVYHITIARPLELEGYFLEKTGLTVEFAEDGEEALKGRLAAGTLELQLEPTPLQPVLESARAVVELQAAEAGVALSIEDPPDGLGVRTSRDRLRQVLVQLLDNAIKYSPPGGVVRMNAETDTDEGGQRVVIRVADEGPGIPPEEAARIFEPYRQLDTGLAAGGIGLGLAIARALVDRMGGSLVLEEPGPDQGAVFTVRLAPAD